MKNNETSNQRMYRMSFGIVYPLYVKKVERKGHTADEVDVVISWLTGYSKQDIERAIADGHDFETFFKKAPRIHPNASKITGVICGVRVEEIEDPLVQKVRYLDKLIDEVANGRSMEKILRKD